MWRLLVFLATGHWPKDRVVTASGKALTELSERQDDTERRLRTVTKKLHTLEGHFYADWEPDDDELEDSAAPAGAVTAAPASEPAPAPRTFDHEDFPEAEFADLVKARRVTNHGGLHG